MRCTGIITCQSNQLSFVFCYLHYWLIGSSYTGCDCVTFQCVCVCVSWSPPFLYIDVGGQDWPPSLQVRLAGINSHVTPSLAKLMKCTLVNRERESRRLERRLTGGRHFVPTPTSNSSSCKMYSSLIWLTLCSGLSNVRSVCVCVFVLLVWPKQNFKGFR